MSRNSRQKWKLTDLKDHPKEAEFFPDYNRSDAEFDALVEDIDRNGLRDPVEIVPDGTLVAGHRRVRAARQLGWTEIEVIVLTDLAAQGADAIERRLIEDNLNRRQLTPLGRARCISALYELHRPDPDEWRSQPRGDVRDVIGDRMGMKGRTVSRYMLVLQTPLAVQNAFDRGALSLVQAGQVAGLPKEKQEDIARRIEAGKDPRLLIEEYVVRDCNRAKPNARFFSFVVELRQTMAKRPRSTDELEPESSARPAFLEFFDFAIAELGKLRSWVEANLGHKPQEEDPDAEFFRMRENVINDRRLASSNQPDIVSDGHDSVAPTVNGSSSKAQSKRSVKCPPKPKAKSRSR